MLFSGYLKVPADGAYTIMVETEGEALLRIHEAVLLEADFRHSKSGGVRRHDPAAGGHSSLPPVLSARHGGPGELRFLWHRGSEPDEVVPASVLFHEESAHP